MAKCYMGSGIFIEGNVEESNYGKVIMMYLPLSHLQIVRCVLLRVSQRCEKLYTKFSILNLRNSYLIKSRNLGKKCNSSSRFLWCHRNSEGSGIPGGMAELTWSIQCGEEKTDKRSHCSLKLPWKGKNNFKNWGSEISEYVNSYG